MPTNRLERGTIRRSQVVTTYGVGSVVPVADESVMIALRTQQILGYESGVPGVVDPLAGSYFVESLTDAIESEALALIERIDELGGAVGAIESGFQQREIEEAAYSHARQVDAKEAVVVGVNRFTVEDEDEPEVMVIDPELEAHQVAELANRRARREAAAVDAALVAITDTARGTDNLMYPLKEALVAGASIGDVTRALLPVFGRYRPTF